MIINGIFLFTMNREDITIRLACQMRIFVICTILLLLPNFTYATLVPDNKCDTYQEDGLWIEYHDTCYVPYKTDTLIIIAVITKDSYEEIVSYHISFANHPFRSPKQLNSFISPDEDWFEAIERRDRQATRYTRATKDTVPQYVNSTIAHFLPVGTEKRIKELYPYEFRDLNLDIDKDGYILAAKLYIRNPVQFMLWGGSQGCGDILSAFIGKRIPIEQLPTIGNGFQLHIPTFKVKEE